jgi:hypothetical protein
VSAPSRDRPRASPDAAVARETLSVGRVGCEKDGRCRCREDCACRRSVPHSGTVLSLHGLGRQSDQTRLLRGVRSRRGPVGEPLASRYACARGATLPGHGTIVVFFAAWQRAVGPSSSGSRARGKGLRARPLGAPFNRAVRDRSDARPPSKRLISHPAHDAASCGPRIASRATGHDQVAQTVATIPQPYRARWVATTPDHPASRWPWNPDEIRTCPMDANERRRGETSSSLGHPM